MVDLVSPDKDATVVEDVVAVAVADADAAALVAVLMLSPVAPLRKNRAELPPPVGTSTMSKVAFAPGALRLCPPPEEELRRLSREARESKLSTEFFTRSKDEDDE